MTKLIPMIMFIGVSLFAQDFKQIPYAEKLKEKDLTLLVTFDKHNINADLAKGNKLSLENPDISLSLRGQMGFDGSNAYKPEGGERITFSVPGNVNTETGTLSMWLRAEDFDPADKNLKQNVGIFKMVLPLPDNESIVMFGYLYEGKVCLSYHIQSTKAVWGSNRKNFAEDCKFKRGEWFQYVCSWDKEKIAYYVNGVCLSESSVPSYRNSYTSVPAAKDAVLELVSPVWGLKVTLPLYVDDIKVYDRVLNAREIRGNYNALCLKKAESTANDLLVTHSGQDLGPGKVPRLLMEIDAVNLEKAENIAYELKGSNGFIKKGTAVLKEKYCRLEFELPATGNDYIFTVNCGKINKVYKFTTPDFSFTQIPPRGDRIIPPWTAPVFGEDRSVTVWNRKYEFGEGPFPKQITVGDLKLFLKEPTLTADGKAITWKAGKSEHGKSWIEFTGTGEGANFTVDYKTRVEFDGMIEARFTIKGEPTLESLKLDWQVAPEIRDYLMTPRVYTEDKILEFGYPSSTFRNHCLLWAVSEKGGFCWTPENNANWVNSDPAKAVSADRKQGRYTVNFISKQVKFPADVPYCSYFTATPTRPLIKEKRGLYQDGAFIHAFGEKYMASYEVADSLLKNYAAEFREKSIFPYGQADSQMLYNPIVAYLKKYWEIPGSYIYRERAPTADIKTGKYDFGKPKVGLWGPTVSVCYRDTILGDYLSSNIANMLNREYGNRFRFIYFDICGGNTVCRNRVHGCGYEDKFGQSVGTNPIKWRRDFLLRVIEDSHKKGISVMTHGQDDFNPMFNGLADYWYPGEQFDTIIRQDHKYLYMDKVPDEFYRTEANRNILGCGVQFLPVIHWNQKFMKTPDATESMIAMLLLHDIEFQTTQAHQECIYMLWNTFRHYKMEDPSVKAHRYYEQNEVKSSVPEILITWYECPDNYKLLVLVNKTSEPRTTEIDFSALNIKTDMVRDEYANADIPAKNGKFKITVPAKKFSLVAVPVKPFYPCRDDFTYAWYHYMNDVPGYADTYPLIPHHDGGVHRNAAPSMSVPPPGEWLWVPYGVPMPPDIRHTYLRFLPVKAGYTYSGEVWCKTEGLPDDAQVRVIMQPLNSNMQPSCWSMPVFPLKKANTDWQKIEFGMTMPAETKFLRIEVERMNAPREAKVWLDDFFMKEISPSAAKENPASGKELFYKFNQWGNKNAKINWEKYGGNDNRVMMTFLPDTQAGASGCFMTYYPLLKAGEKIEITLMAKAVDVQDKDATLFISVQGTGKDYSYIGTKNFSETLPAKEFTEWKTLKLEFVMPEKLPLKWDLAESILCTFGANSVNGSFLFKDFKIEKTSQLFKLEKQEKSKPSARIGKKRIQNASKNSKDEKTSQLFFLGQQEKSKPATRFGEWQSKNIKALFSQKDGIFSIIFPPGDVRGTANFLSYHPLIKPGEKFKIKLLVKAADVQDENAVISIAVQGLGEKRAYLGTYVFQKDVPAKEFTDWKVLEFEFVMPEKLPRKWNLAEETLVNFGVTATNGIFLFTDIKIEMPNQQLNLEQQEKSKPATRFREWQSKNIKAVFSQKDEVASIIFPAGDSRGSANFLSYHPLLKPGEKFKIKLLAKATDVQDENAVISIAVQGLGEKRAYLGTYVFQKDVPAKDFTDWKVLEFEFVMPEKLPRKWDLAEETLVNFGATATSGTFLFKDIKTEIVR